MASGPDMHMLLARAADQLTEGEAIEAATVLLSLFEPEADHRAVLDALEGQRDATI